MFFPLYDNMPEYRRSRAVWGIIWALILAQICLFIAYGTKGEFATAIQIFGLETGRFPSISNGEFWHLFNYISYLFIHDGLFHLFGNLYFLYLFGRTVESQFGSLKFALFCLICGIVAGLCETYVEADLAVLVIGASGSITGVIAAYVLLFPHARIECLVIFFPIIRRIDVPAYAFTSVWFALQLINAFLQIPGTAWYAHIGGFIAGLLLCIVFKKSGVPLLLPKKETGQKAAWIAERKHKASGPAVSDEIFEIAWIASLLPSPKENAAENAAEIAAITYNISSKLIPPYDGPISLGANDPEMDKNLRQAARLLFETYDQKAPSVADNCADNLRLNGDKIGSDVWRRIRWLTNILTDVEARETGS